MSGSGWGLEEPAEVDSRDTFPNKVRTQMSQRHRTVVSKHKASLGRIRAHSSGSPSPTWACLLSKRAALTLSP